MNMVGVNSRQQGEGGMIGEGGGEKGEPTLPGSELLDDLSNLGEGSISDDGGATPGSSVNGAQSQPTTRSDSKKTKRIVLKNTIYFKGDE